MRRPSRAAVLAVATLTVGLLAACAPASQLASKPAGGAATRVVSLAPTNTEILFAVGAGSKVVGVTAFCTYPPEAAAVERVGGFTAPTLSVERIAALKPDLVLGDRWAHSSLVPTLERFGLRVVLVGSADFDDVFANVILVGALCDRRPEAEALVAAMKHRIAGVAARVASVPGSKRLRVFWEAWDSPLITAGSSSFAGQVLAAAGAINVFADASAEWPIVSTEELVRRNPQVIMSSERHGERLSVERIATRPGWSRIDAVQNGRVHLVDGDLVSRAGPRLALALETVARGLYPEIFE